MEPDSNGWQIVDLPHDWSIELPRKASNPSGTSNGFFEMGQGFYHKTIETPQAWQGKKVFVEFEGVYMNAEIWLDEHFLTRHPYGYTSFMVDLTPYLKLGEKQALKVRVNNSGQLNSRWYSGSGIYRPAWLIVAEPIHLAEWGIYVTTPEVSGQSALVRARATVLNETPAGADLSVRARVIAPDGTSVASGEAAGRAEANASLELSMEMRVSEPLLWSPDAPHLYRLETEVYSGTTLVDQETTVFGIRSIAFSAENGFLLNGQMLKLKGGCVHHDNGVLGAASYTRSEERKVEVLKASGFNAVRCAHNPPAPQFLDACDRLGMLVMDEAFDCWRDGKNPFDYHVEFDSWWQRDIDNMVVRDRNHPAIILWSIGNEVLERDRPEGAGIARMLAERVRELDPSRAVSSGICGSWTSTKWYDTDGTFASLDVGGYNYLWRNYEPDHVRFPQRVMAGTESFPIEALENWVAVLDHSYVIGDFVWTSLDYLGESGIGRVKFNEKEDFLGDYPWHQANCGDLDICGFKRPQSFYRDIVWEVGTQLYIAVHTPVPEGKTATISQWGWPDVWPNWNWAGQEGKEFQVDVYSACEEVELLLNGRSLGRQPSSRAEKHTATFNVAYEPGVLSAVGYNQGAPAAEQVLKTAAPAAALRLTADHAQLRAGESDLGFIHVEIVDADGQVHPAADRPVFFTAAGAGELAAVGSGNPISEEDYRGHMRSTFRGQCLAVVKAGGSPGQLTLRAQADGLLPAEISLNVE
jgi:beta-galactosidase